MNEINEIYNCSNATNGRLSFFGNVSLITNQSVMIDLLDLSVRLKVHNITLAETRGQPSKAVPLHLIPFFFP